MKMSLEHHQETIYFESGAVMADEESVDKDDSLFPGHIDRGHA